MNKAKCYIITSQMHYYKHDCQLEEKGKKKKTPISVAMYPFNLTDQKCL